MLVVLVMMTTARHDRGSLRGERLEWRFCSACLQKREVSRPIRTGPLLLPSRLSEPRSKSSETHARKCLRAEVM